MLSEEELRKRIGANTQPGGVYGSQKVLAELMGVSENYVSLIVRGRCNISAETAAFFGYDLRKMYFEKELP